MNRLFVRSFVRCVDVPFRFSFDRYADKKKALIFSEMKTIFFLLNFERTEKIEFYGCELLFHSVRNC